MLRYCEQAVWLENEDCSSWVHIFYRESTEYYCVLRIRQKKFYYNNDRHCEALLKFEVRKYFVLRLNFIIFEWVRRQNRHRMQKCLNLIEILSRRFRRLIFRYLNSLKSELLIAKIETKTDATELNLKQSFYIADLEFWNLKHEILAQFDVDTDVENFAYFFFKKIFWATCQSVWFVIDFAWSIRDLIIKTWQKFTSTNLTTIKLFDWHKIFEILVICDYFDKKKRVF